MASQQKDCDFSCDTCGKFYIDKSSLKRHINLSHLREKKFVCDVCGSKFVMRCHLKRHMKVHSESKPHECKMCEKAFRWKHSLDDHYRVHRKQAARMQANSWSTGQCWRLFCNVCGQQFQEKESLAEHLDKHFQDRLHECKMCNSRFTGAFLLAQHMKVHNQDKPYLCPHCGSEYEIKNALISHLQLHAKEMAPAESLTLLTLNLLVKEAGKGLDAEDVTNFVEQSFDKEESGNILHETSMDTATSSPHVINGSADFLSPQTNATDGMAQMDSQGLLGFEKNNQIDQQKEHHDQGSVEVTSEKKKRKKLQGGRRRKSQAPTSAKALKMVLNDNGMFEYVCDICSKTFSVKHHLLRHKRVHTNDTPYICDFCKREFKWYSSLSAHLEAHKSKKVEHLPSDDFICTHCSAAFDSEEILQEHSKTHTEPCKSDPANSYACLGCTQSFATEFLLSQHLLTHKDVTLYHCTICRVPFQEPQALESHMDMHNSVELTTTQNRTECSDGKRIKCSQCSKTFRCKAHLKKHLPFHTGRRRYMCWICGKAFMWHSSYSNHIRYHASTEEKRQKHQCSSCGKRFLNMEELKQHEATHLTARLFQCEECKKLFKSSSALKRHSYLHSDKGRFQCENCLKEFKWHSAWSVHLQARANAKDCVCSQCEITFCLRTEYNKHMLMHK